jgi:uncharacterized protein YaiL (DUF2058 family)
MTLFNQKIFFYEIVQTYLAREMMTMGNTLQDQFLKMGLVDKKQVNTLKKAQHKQKASNKESINEGKIQAQQALAAKKEHSRLLNQKKNEELKEQETAAQIRQLIDSNRVSMAAGETPYNFIDDNKIKRLLLNKETIEQLSGGSLAIVRQAGEYLIVPAEIALKVQKFNRKLVVVFHTQRTPHSADHEDPYAEFQVPEDLIW